MRGGGVVLVLVAACGSSSSSNDGRSSDGRAIDGRPDAWIVYDDWWERYCPTTPYTLGASPGNDEDPAVLRAFDQSIYVAWYSEGAGNDIVISRTTTSDGWSSPVHVTTGPATDFGPSLFQDGTGVFHAVWFRWDAGAPPGHIMHNHSADGLTWDPATEVAVTGVGAWDDWLPSIAALDDTTLIVAFARNTCPPPDECYAIYTSTSADGETWTTPALVVPATAGEEQHAPTLGAGDGELRLVWNPFDTAADAPWDSTTTGGHVATMRYVPGTGWTDRRDVTVRDPSAVTLLPTLYADRLGSSHVAWLAADANGSSVVEIPVSGIGSATPSQLPSRATRPRWSPRPSRSSTSTSARRSRARRRTARSSFSSSSTTDQVGFIPSIDFAMIRRWICPVPSKMS